jgi:hypothetical protein
MKKLLVVALLASTPSFAQQMSQDVQSSFAETVRLQRNNALDQAALLNAQLQVVQKQLSDEKSANEKMKKELDELKAKPAKPEEVPKEAK